MIPEKRLAAAFRQAMDFRRDLLANGSTTFEADAAVAKILRANWPAIPPEQEWPYKYRLPRCLYCDGYGLVIREVTNRLGCRVNEGTPCSCEQGARYREKPQGLDEDFIAAGKTPQKAQKGFSRWNG